MKPTGSKPAIIGLISDTHGLLRPEAIQALAGSDLIIHAGDIGKLEILDQLEQVAPIIAVKGNIDKQAWAKNLPETQIVEAGNSTIYVLHNLKELDLVPKAAGIDFVISGHTHKPAHEQSDGITYINPGAAGPKRFKLPITIAILDVSQFPYSLTFKNLLDATHT